MTSRSWIITNRENAVRLDIYFGIDAQSWMNLQTHYDTERAREAIGKATLARRTHAAAS